MVICVGGGWMAHGASLRLACGLMRDVNKGLKMTYQNDNLDTEDIQRGGAQ